MNSAQIVFLILIFLPLVVSVFTERFSLLLMYLVELGFIMFVMVFAVLGNV